MDFVYSKNKVLIRLTEERWFHIVESHDELAGRAVEVLETVAEPDIIIKGKEQEFLAVKKSKGKWLIVVYKEVNIRDGFIITAFLTSKIQYLLKKETVWKK